MLTPRSRASTGRLSKPADCRRDADRASAGERAPARQLLIGGELVVRESTGPAPGSIAPIERQRRERADPAAMKIVITGGSGKAGRAVVRDLLETGHEVFNVDRVPSAESSSPDSPVPFLYADLTDTGQTLEALGGGERMPGIGGGRAPRRDPVAGARDAVRGLPHQMISTHTVFSAAARLGLQRVVWASSETTLGLPFDQPPDYAPVDEEHELRPESSYALSKVLGEEMARQFNRWSGIPFVGLRFSNIMERADYERFPSFWDESPAAQVEPVELRRREPRRPERPPRARGRCPRRGRLHHRRRRHRDEAAEPRADGRGVPGRARPRRPRGHDTLLAIDKARRVLGYDPAFSWRKIF